MSDTDKSLSTETSKALTAAHVTFKTAFNCRIFVLYDAIYEKARLKSGEIAWKMVNIAAFVYQKAFKFSDFSIRFSM